MKIYPLHKRRLHMPRRFKPVNIAASVMTTMNLYMGVASIFASIGQDFKWAAQYILIAIVFDILDGFVARLTKSASEFGKQLDSLCDLVSFGVAPAVLVFMAYLPEGTQLPLGDRAEAIVGAAGSYMGIIYVICTALRLARFNTFQADKRDSFVGLPSPAAGGTLAAFVLFLHYFESKLTVSWWAYFMLGPTMVVLAILMVSTVSYPKSRLKAFIVKPQHAFVTLAMCAFIIAVIHAALTRSAALVMFPLALCYILFGLFDTAWARFRRTEGVLAGVGGDSDSSDELDADLDVDDLDEQDEEGVEDSPRNTGESL